MWPIYTSYRSLQQLRSLVVSTFFRRGKLNEGSQRDIQGLTGGGFQVGTRGPLHFVPEDRRLLTLRMRFLITYSGGQRDVPGLTGEGEFFRKEKTPLTKLSFAFISISLPLLLTPTSKLKMGLCRSKDP